MVVVEILALEKLGVFTGNPGFAMGLKIFQQVIPVPSGNIISQNASHLIFLCFKHFQMRKQHQQKKKMMMMRGMG
jgi:hypothetical protein